MGTVLKVLLSVSFIVGCVKCTPCRKVESLDITSGDRLENGSISHEGIVYTNAEWYEVEQNETVLVYGCPCIQRICLWKCCGEGEAYYGRTCNETDISEVHPFSPSIYKGKEPVTSLEAHNHFYYMYNNHLCDDNRYLLDISVPRVEFYIQQNGSLFEVTEGQKLWRVPGSFCVDMTSMGNTRIVAAVCFQDDDIEIDDSPQLYLLYAIGLLLSVPFLLITVLVYAIIPELRNLHGMCLMAYCVGLIIGYTLLAYLQISNNEVGLTMPFCLTIAFTVYYVYQTSFFWLNVMCFDIWRTFSGYRGGGTNKKREVKRFALYGVYAWGVPLLLTAVTAFMQFNDEIPDNIIRPNFGKKKCWFYEWVGQLVYFYTPVLLLVVCNVVLFAITANRIRSIKQETAILKGAESARSDRLKRDKQRYGLYLKLFMVMGVNWTVELVSFAVGGSNWYWILSDLSNLMLGFFIFMIFVWKSKVRNLVRKRFRSIRGTRSATDSGTARWATRSSSAPTEDTRITSTTASDDNAIRLKDM